MTIYTFAHLPELRRPIVTKHRLSYSLRMGAPFSSSGHGLPTVRAWLAFTVQLHMTACPWCTSATTGVRVKAWWEEEASSVCGYTMSKQSRPCRPGRWARPGASAAACSGAQGQGSAARLVWTQETRVYIVENDAAGRESRATLPHV